MTKRWPVSLAACLTVVFLHGSTLPAGRPQAQTVGPAAALAPAEKATLDRYCLDCHNEKVKTAGLALDTLAVARPGDHAEAWEKVVRKLRGRMMPPAGRPRPDEAGYDSVISYLETSLDRAAADHPNPGRTDTFRRLNRTEYHNAVRDLLDLDVDTSALLPKDDASHGFDNVGVGELSPTLLERYLAAAQKVSRLAVGRPLPSPGSYVVVLPSDLTQEDHLEGLPLGTRGGTVVRYTFPLDGEYDIQVKLARDRNENVEGLTEPQQMELALDGARLGLFAVKPNRNQSGAYYADEEVDKDLKTRVRVTAGPHELTAVFLRKTFALPETERQPYIAHYNMDRHPRIQTAVYSVAIAGPFNDGGAADSPSRKRIFVCQPGAGGSETACAKTILAKLARRAYRRPVGDKDIEAPLVFFEKGRAEGGFDAGIEMALRAILASTEFLFRVERDPVQAAPGTNYPISDLDLASRLSFFLWSSIPDEELLQLAERGGLRDRPTLERQVQRMLADPRADALVTNFAGQWLYLRNLAAQSPDARLFPDFDDNLRQAFRRETELFFDSVVKEDRNVLDLLRADYTFVNERLARHYGIPNVYGSRFRRVTLEDGSVRGGLLGQGSILTVTSYANRTSPVLRGKWILENILGSPPPPPPPNVPPLPDNAGNGHALSMRERMSQHRANPACAGCHQMMDPAGLSMENFDAIGRWRARTEAGKAVDASGSLPDGAAFDGVAGLRAALLRRPELFVATMTEKLLTYAVGRGTEYYDAPTVRAIVHDARERDYRFSSLVLGVIESPAFQMRRVQ
jgi:mono/diheme cytochrome c family protein